MLFMKNMISLILCFVIFHSDAFGNTDYLSNPGSTMIQTNVNDTGALITPGNVLVLQCYIEEHPDVNVIWYKGGSLVNTTDPRITIHNDNHSLVIHSANTEDTGAYMCVMDREILDVIINTTIHVRIKPELKPFGKSLNLLQDDELKLHCAIKAGVPVPKLTWYKNDFLLNDSNERILFSADDIAPNAKLLIKEVGFTDRATYTCVAENDAGKATTSTLVRVKDKYGALWPFIGICGEVAILCLIIFLYEKKRVQPDYDESDTDQQTENKISEENQKEKMQDVRQRK